MKNYYSILLEKKRGGPEHISEFVQLLAQAESHFDATEAANRKTETAQYSSYNLYSVQWIASENDFNEGKIICLNAY